MAHRWIIGSVLIGLFLEVLMLFGLFGCKPNAPPPTPTFQFRVQEVFYIKPPVDRVILVGMVEEGTILTGAQATVRTGGGNIPVTVENIETIKQGNIREATKGQQVGLRLIGITKEQPQQGDLVVSASPGQAIPATSPHPPVNADVQTQAAASQSNNPWFGLRNMVLSFKPEELGVGTGSTDTYGFVMEMGVQNKDAKVTIVALRDGTMSMYLSTGGGVIGTGQRSPQAAEFAKGVVAAVGEFTAKMEKTATFPIPATGRVRFFILTGQGVFTAETDLASLGQGNDPLLPLYVGGQNVMTQIRLASEAPKTSPAKSMSHRQAGAGIGTNLPVAPA